MLYKHTVTLRPSILYPKLLGVLYACTAILLVFSYVPTGLKYSLFLGLGFMFVFALREQGLHGRIEQLILCAPENQVTCVSQNGLALLQFEEVSFPVVSAYVIMMRGRCDGRWRVLWFMRDSLPQALPYQYNRLRAQHFGK